MILYNAECRIACGDWPENIFRAAFRASRETYAHRSLIKVTRLAVYLTRHLTIPQKQKRDQIRSVFALASTRVSANRAMGIAAVAFRWEIVNLASLVAKSKVEKKDGEKGDPRPVLPSDSLFRNQPPRNPGIHFLCG